MGNTICWRVGVKYNLLLGKSKMFKKKMLHNTFCYIIISYIILWLTIGNRLL